VPRVSLTALADALTRRAALDDLRLTLPAARIALRLLWIAARDGAERRLVEAAGDAVDEARAAIRWLR
jgi:hypothetical protein